MKVEFTAPQLLKGESINSQLGFFPLLSTQEMKCEFAQPSLLVLRWIHF